jgi:acyl-CoA thioesterase YciA
MRHKKHKPLPAGDLMLQIVPMPKDTNPNGDIHAGWLVGQMDLAAASSAGRLSQGRTATVAIEGMEFISPVRVGSHVSCYTKLVDIGRSSIKITVEVWTQDHDEPRPRKVTQSTFIFVAIDEDGRIRQLPNEALHP